MPDPYLIPGMFVLRNKLGLTDFKELSTSEYEYAVVGAIELFKSERKFQISMRAWRTIHKGLLHDVYDWAGEYRTIFISKENERGLSRFCAPDRIEVEGTKALEGLKAALKYINQAPLPKVMDAMADSYIALNQVHPFREGNGRSQKLFFSLIARQHGIQLHWNAIDPADHIAAAVNGDHGEPALMREHFRAIGKVRPISDIALSLHGR